MLIKVSDFHEYRQGNESIGGKVMNNDEAVVLTCSKIKTLLGLKLSKDELTREKQISRRT